MTNFQGVGFRSVGDAPDDLRGRMASSPTGRQLASDGSFVLSGFTQDPAQVLLSPSDNTMVLWDNVGVLTLASFTRATGWKYRTMA